MNITIVGGGTWGTTLADMYSKKGCGVRLWLRKEETASEINRNRSNRKYTKNHKLSGGIKATSDVKGVFRDSRIIFLAVPSHAVRQTLDLFNDEWSKSKDQDILSIINVAKGLEVNTNKRISTVLREVLPAFLHEKITTLSGPNIALEILEGLPSVSVIAGNDSGLLKKLQKILSTNYFRLYTNTDITGVELCGAIKNIVAIASGISDGLGYGCNAKASLITRGLYELQKFGLFFGADKRTFPGVAGMGDLITTCISDRSRNRYVGQMLARGKTIEDITGSMDMVAEGVNTTKAVYSIASREDIELPITESIYDIIYNKEEPIKSVNMLMQRKFKSEL